MDFWQKRNSKTSAKSNVQISELEWQGHLIKLQRKAMRSIRLSISPLGNLTVSLPYQVSDQEVVQFLKSKADWIEKHLERFLEHTKDEPKDFSRLPFLGVSYPTAIHYHPIAPRVVLNSNGIIDLFLKPGTKAELLPKIIDTFYRSELKRRIEPLVREWEPIMNVEVHAIQFKRMKTRWGTCNVVDHRIWFNTELGKVSYPCIEYIVVHEMCHLLEIGHGPKFKACMDKYLPHWRALRLELNGKGVRY